MSEFEIESDAVGVSAADASNFCESGSDQFGDDFLHHAFGDTDTGSDFAECCSRIAIEAQQDVHVIREERPVGDVCTRLRLWGL